MSFSSHLTRRAALHNGSLWLLGAGLTAASEASLWAETQAPRARVGLVTDLHYADKPSAGTRHYRESLAKLTAAAAELTEAKPDFCVELGDLIDAAESVEVERKFLATINKTFSSLPGDKHYVLGNHCVTTLTKEEFLGDVGQAKAYYSFDVAGIHFVILDACYLSDGTAYGRGNVVWTDANIPAEQVEWLRSDLKATAHPTVVFVHQRLDVENAYGIKNAADVRKVLEASGKVLAVFQGHSHKNDVKQLAGIHYCTLVAMVEGAGAENSGFSLMEVFDKESIRLSGFHRQASYHWQDKSKD